jgi:hypothetical protein
MTPVLADSDRLLAVWNWGRAEAQAKSPEYARRREIDAELGRRGLLARMAAASAVARSPAYAEAVNARASDRAAARTEDDLARILTACLVEAGADMTDLQVRLRRVTDQEKRRAGAPRRAAQLRMRITPTIEAARAAVAAVDGQPAGGGSSDTDASGVAQAGQGDVVGLPSGPSISEGT